jgi:hypothetical protein
MAGSRRGIDAMAGVPAGRRALMLGLAAAFAGSFAGAAAAQTSGAAPPGATPPPDLKLSPAQRQLVYASLSKRTHTSTAAPPTFGAALGGILPEAIELVPLPETVVEMVPQLRGHAYAFVAGQVLIVEPQARRIVEIIAESASRGRRAAAV